MDVGMDNSTTTAGGDNYSTTIMGAQATSSPYHVTADSLIKASLLGFTAILVLFGNTMCLIVLRLTHDGVSPVTKLFLVSLTISDLLVGVLVCVPVIGSTALQSWPYGDAYCTVVAMCHTLYFNASLSVLAINIERYIAVIWPLRYPSIVTIRKAIIVEIFVFAMLLAWTLMYVLGSNRSAFYYNNFSVCFIDSNDGSDIMGQLGMTVFLAVPMVITVILHIRLFLLATHHAAKVSSIVIGDINPSSVKNAECLQIAEPQAHRQSNTQTVRSGRVRARSSPETKAARTFFIMAAVAAISWAPYYVTISWENVRAEPVPGALAFVSQILLLLNSLWNVIIYYTRNNAFRKTANRVLGCCLRVHPRREEELPL